MNQMIELLEFVGQPLAMDQYGLRNLITATSTAVVIEKRKQPVATLVSASGESHVMDEPGDGVPQGQFVAVVPLDGALSMHGGFFSTSTTRFAKTIAALDASASVGGIVVSVNSPGGTVSGTMEAANVLRGVRERGKTATASVTNPMMASAATWIGAAADRVYVTPSGQAGSIGVISWYEDVSAMLEKYGVKVDVIRTPDKKARFTGVEPMTDEMREEMETRNRAAYTQFVAAMAANRGVSADAVQADFGGGEMLDAEQAVAAGLVDAVATLDQVVSGMVAAVQKKQSNRNRLALAGL